jgi:hypothetical protein
MNPMVYVWWSVELERPATTMHGGAAVWVVTSEAFLAMAR